MLRQLPPTKRARQGSVTTEAAVCLPVLVSIVFGAMQACDTIHLQHVATLAAYEGTLAASAADATRTRIRNRANNLLNSLKVSGAQVAISPNVANLAQLAPGTLVTVTVTAPVKQNLSGPAFFSVLSQLRAAGVTSR